MLEQIKSITAKTSIFKCSFCNTLVRLTNKQANNTIHSCGCNQMDHVYKHGDNMSNEKRHPLYITWFNMLARCTNPNHPSYNRYGGRNITVCSKWHTYEQFKADVLHLWRPGLVIDRIDNDKNYTPGNVRFTTYTNSNRNRSNTHYVQFGHRKVSIAEYAKLENLSYSQAYYLFKKQNKTKAILVEDSIID